MKQTARTRPRIFAAFFLSAALAASPAFAASRARQQEHPPAEKPSDVLSDALSSACRQDANAFASELTADNALAYRALPAAERIAFMRRFVLLDDAGRPLLSTGLNGRTVLRCEAPGVTSEMRFGQPRVRDNLAFIPIEIPVEGAAPRSITFGLVREGGNWKLLSAGLLLLDIPAMARQWEQQDVESHENEAIQSLRTLASALQDYRQDYGKLPESLTALGPAPPGGVSPEAASMVGADLASGKKDGYTFRYSQSAPSGNLTQDEASQGAGFQLAATPDQYGKTGRRSFYLDSTGVLRGADKKGAVATSTDPPVQPSQNPDS